MQKTATLLLVDDNPDNLSLLQQAVSRFLPDCAVHTVRSADACLAAATSIEPDGALIACQMSGLDGIELCRRLKANPASAQVPVVLLTDSHFGSKDKAEAFEAGVNDFMARPIDTIELVARIKTILRMKQAEDQLRSIDKGSEERWKFAIEGSAAGVWDWNVQTNETYYSELWKNILGYQGDEIGTSGEEWVKRVHPEDMDVANKEIERHFQGEIPYYSFEHRMRCKDGSYKWFQGRGKVISRTADGQPSRMVGTNTDITGQKTLQARLQQSQQHLAKAQQIARFGSWRWDITSGEVLWSDEVFQIFDLLPGDSTPTYELFLAHVHPDDRTTVHAAIQQALTAKTPYAIDHRIVLKNGSIRHVSQQGQADFDALGKPLAMTGVTLDITERKEAELALREKREHLKYLAHYDSLTDLPNRVLLQDRLQQAIRRAKRNGMLLGILFLDLDNFKKVNDTFGHHIGDSLLREVALRLKSLQRAGDTVARLAGDEFVIVIEEAASIENIAHAAQKVLDGFEAPLSVEGRQFFLTLSIGISTYPENAEDVSTLLKCADISMHATKLKNRNAYQFYSPEMDARAHELLLLGNDLRLAIKKEQLVLYYQPQVDIATGQLLGFEALIRWQHPEKGLVPPDDFIPLAEESGLIVPIGAWILQTACAQARTFLDSGVQPFRMCVNISMPQFRAADSTLR